MDGTAIVVITSIGSIATLASVIAGISGVFVKIGEQNQKLNQHGDQISRMAKKQDILRENCNESFMDLKTSQSSVNTQLNSLDDRVGRIEKTLDNCTGNTS